MNINVYLPLLAYNWLIKRIKYYNYSLLNQIIVNNLLTFGLKWVTII